MIESVNNEKIKTYSKLLDKKYRDKENMFLISTEHLVLEAIKKDIIIEIFLLKNKENKFGNVTYVTEPVMRKLTNLNTLPSVVAVVKKIEPKEIKGNVLMLDGIQDPGNLGTIIRSSVAFNVDTIILGDNTVDIYNEKVLRAAEGMIFNINFIKQNLIESIKILKQKNYKILGTKVDTGKDIKDIHLDKYALLVGNEGNGVNKELLELCDENLYININNKCESLNVAIATSIIIYELNKNTPTI